jgi:insertion element IS1 protein InsB
MKKNQCPLCTCSSTKHGTTRHGQQRYKCKSCDYQFSNSSKQKVITDAELSLINKLLLERLSLRGICRAMDVSMPWLLKHIKQLYNDIPDHLYILTTDMDFASNFDEQLDGMICKYLEKKSNI